MTQYLGNHPAISELKQAGISFDDAVALRRIAMTLHRWHELECGTDSGAIEQDEENGKWFARRDYHDKMTGWNTIRWQIANRERGALKRLGKIMAKYPTMQAYVQGDPRGPSLYIVRASDLNGCDIDANYNRGIAVYK
jgi:hypothetical protein